MKDTRRTKGKADAWWTHGGQTFETQQNGHKADTWRTRFGGAAKWTQGGHKGDAWQTKGGHMADTWADARRTHGGQGLEARPKRTEGRCKGDAWRTHGGQAPGTRPEHNAASQFSKREPHSKLFGENTKLCFNKGALRVQ